MAGKDDIIRVEPRDFKAGFNWSVGFQMERFIKALGDKKILASKCPKCGYTYVPPRDRCGKCNAAMDEKDNVELSGKGELAGYTTAHVELDGAGNFVDLKKPVIMGAVKLEGADSTLFMPLEGVKEKDLKEGLKLIASWAEKPKGEIPDLKGFKPQKATAGSKAGAKK
jgi:uncharacterized OB-fold protein